MNDIMNVDEIHRRFAAEWVLLEDPLTDPQKAVLGGKVLWHSTQRDEVYEKAIALKPKHFAILYTGSVPEELVPIL